MNLVNFARNCFLIPILVCLEASCIKYRGHNPSIPGDLVLEQWYKYSRISVRSIVSHRDYIKLYSFCVISKGLYLTVLTGFRSPICCITCGKYFSFDFLTFASIRGANLVFIFTVTILHASPIADSYALVCSIIEVILILSCN